jgi:hypothetical protein
MPWMLGNASESSAQGWIRFSVEENSWSQSSPSGEPEEIEWDSPVLIDVEKVKFGWLKLMGGRDFLEWKGTPSEKPSDEYKQAFSVNFYSTKLFGEDTVKEFCSSGQGVTQFLRALYNEAESGFGKGQVPAVRIKRAEKVKLGRGSTKIPQFEIVGWKPRPKDLSGSAADPEPAPAKAKTAKPVPADDDSFDDDGI